MQTSAALGAIAGAAACGTANSGGAGQSAKPGAAPKQITLSKTQSSPFKEQAWADTFAQAQKSTGVKITLAVEPGDTYWDKRQAEFAGGTANADVIYNQPNWVLGGGLAGMFADLMPLFKRDKLDMSQYYKADMDSWTWKGKLYGFPFQIEGETVFYNKQLLTAKGVPFPKADWSTDDLLQAAQKVNDPANNHFGLLVENQTIQYSIGTFIRLFGGQVFTEARDKALYGDDGNALKGFQYEVDLPNKYQVIPTADATKTLPTGTRAMEGRLVAMAIGDISRHQDIRNALGAENLDFAPTPKGPTGIRSARVYSNDWSILSLSKAQDAAWEVLKWTHSKEGMSGPQLQAIGWPPVKWASQTPQWIEPFKNSHVADAQKLWETNGHNQAVLPEGAQALTIANDALGRAIRGEITARDALKESADKLNQLFSQRPPAWK
jgi:multiple sugar transport system substrate-binding protein